LDTSILRLLEVAHVEIIHGIGVYTFSHPQRVRGALVTVRGRIYLLGACRRGIFYRFGASIYSPARGRFDAVFGLRTRIGAIDLLFTKWLRDEILPVRFGCDWVRGHINISRSGLYSFVLGATEPELLAEIARRNWKISSASEIEDASFYSSDYEESDKLDCD
jgi:hypothetical protein